MDYKIVAIGNTEIKKHKFHYHRNPISIFDITINKIVVGCNKFSFGKN